MKCSVALSILRVGIGAEFDQCLDILKLQTDGSEMKSCGTFPICVVHINPLFLYEIVYTNYAVVPLGG